MFVLNKIKSLLTAILFLSCSIAGFQPAYGKESRENRSVAKLISSVSQIPSNGRFRLGVRISVPQGSHIYWKNPGEIGSPLNIHWDLPEGFVVEEEFWSAPVVFEEDGMTFFGYADQAFIEAVIRTPDGYSEGLVHIGARVEWLACGHSCVPGRAQLQLSVPYGDEAIESVDAVEFAQAMQSRPRVLGDQPIFLNKNELVVHVPDSSRAEKVWFISDRSDKIFACSEGAKREGVHTPWRLKVKSLSALRKNQELHGVLVLVDHAGRHLGSFTIQGQVGEEKSGALIGFLTILAMAFLGGLLLNIMPCVLPLVTLKVYGLIKSAGENRYSVLWNGLCFTFGVVGCFWALAGTAWVLKVLGHNIGWGFQLQEPMFVAVLMIVFFLFALSSLGLFEMGSLFANLGGRLQGSEEGKNKAVAAVCNGVLATLVTTPCTGPFLGSVLGLVMSVSFIAQLSIFTAIGVGMALPYLIFSLFPKALTILPKPGSWMGTFKQITGFMLLGTVVWLAWIFGAETSATALVILCIGLWLAGVGSWVLGKWGVPVLPRRSRMIASSVFFISVLGSLALGFVASRHISEPEGGIQEGEWKAFSASALEQLRKEGRPVFVNFTAKWCLTCQVNKAVLYAGAVQEMFKQNGIVMLEADWTRKDPEITEELARLGRASVPSYVYYPAHQGDPVVLPEKLTPAVLKDLIFTQD